MSIPTELFSNLAIPEAMRFAALDIEQRKVRVRDILASFDRDTLPSEYREDVFESITTEQAARGGNEWTNSNDLEATLMVWCVHSKEGWEFLNMLHPPNRRAKLFAEKLQRLFRAVFDDYAQLQNRPQSIPSGEVLARLTAIANTFRDLVLSVEVDLETRSEGVNLTATVLLDTLYEVCQKHEDISHLRRSMRLSGNVNLYYRLIHHPPPESDDFMLDALQIIADISPRVFTQNEIRGKLSLISGLLMSNSAPEEYQTRFREICGVRRA